MTILKSNNGQNIQIFAYLRKSTNKEEQKYSLDQQEDGIQYVVNKLGFDKDTIKYFVETRSGFENKKRAQWKSLMAEINLCKEPCIIIARDISRLSRNPTDSQWILDRVYGDNGAKKNIGKIYTLEVDKIKEWNMHTDKEEFHKAVSYSYYDSLDTRKKSIGGVLLKLDNRQFVYNVPAGLKKVEIRGRKILGQTDKMPFIRRAFEMKIEGNTHIKISEFLKLYADIKIGEGDITDRLFKNIVYIGEYKEKTTGKIFTNLEFVEGKPPISRELWDKVQKCLGKKNSQYGEKQENHILASKLKTESGHIFSKYMAKGKYPAYKGRYKELEGNIKFIHIAETEILTLFIKQIQDFINMCISGNNSQVNIFVDVISWNILSDLILFENLEFEESIEKSMKNFFEYTEKALYTPKCQKLIDTINILISNGKNYYNTNSISDKELISKYSEIQKDDEDVISDNSEILEYMYIVKGIELNKNDNIDIRILTFAPTFRNQYKHFCNENRLGGSILLRLLTRRP